ncbi:hypothetical protein KEM56_006922 [Ascosphaera pollenicola]|nr:hypothetical protein KEM56_006922 [Ascosphaera pollenicola]
MPLPKQGHILLIYESFIIILVKQQCINIAQYPDANVEARKVQTFNTITKPNTQNQRSKYEMDAQTAEDVTAKFREISGSFQKAHLEYARVMPWIQKSMQKLIAVEDQLQRLSANTAQQKAHSAEGESNRCYWC